MEFVMEQAFIILLLFAFCAFLLGLAVSICSSWGVWVVGMPWMASRAIVWRLTVVVRLVIRSPILEASLWRVGTLLGVAVGAAMAFWVHYKLFGVWTQRQLVHLVAPLPGEAPSHGLFHRVATFKLGPGGAPLFDGSAAVLLAIVLIPSLGFVAGVYKGAKRHQAAFQIRNHVAYATASLGVCVAVQVILWYTSLGSSLVEILDGVCPAWVYVGVAVGVMKTVLQRFSDVPNMGGAERASKRG
jgi:hypothetical protein